MKIEFEDLTYPRPEMGHYTIYHYGNLIDDEGNEFPLTVVEMYDGNTDYATHEITWVDDTPNNHEELSDKIISALEDCYYDMEQEEVEEFKRQQQIEDDRAYHGGNFNRRTKEIK